MTDGSINLTPIRSLALAAAVASAMTALKAFSDGGSAHPLEALRFGLVGFALAMVVLTAPHFVRALLMRVSKGQR